MIWIAARRIIAAVQHILTLGNFSVGQSIRNTMRQMPATGN